MNYKDPLCGKVFYKRLGEGWIAQDLVPDHPKLIEIRGVDQFLNKVP